MKSENKDHRLEKVKIYNLEELVDPEPDKTQNNDVLRELKGVSGDSQKLEYFSPHTTRHTFTSKAYEAGADMKIVSELLGHSSTSITLDIYTHLTEKKQLEKKETVRSIAIS